MAPVDPQAVLADRPAGQHAGCGGSVVIHIRFPIAPCALINFADDPAPGQIVLSGGAGIPRHHAHPVATTDRAFRQAGSCNCEKQPDIQPRKNKRPGDEARPSTIIAGVRASTSVVTLGNDKP
jgi:hypothetical protein